MYTKLNKKKSENVIIYTNMTGSIRWRRSWIKMLFFKDFYETVLFLPQFEKRHELNSAKQRYQRQPMERVALPVSPHIISKRVNRICLSAPLHAPPAPAEQVPSRTSSPSLAPYASLR